MATSLSKCLGLSLALSLLLACGAAAEGLPELRPDFGAPDEPARWQGRGGQWEFEAGLLRQNKADEYWNVNLRSGEVADFSLSVRCRMLEINESYAAAGYLVVAFRAQNTQQYYCVHLRRVGDLSLLEYASAPTAGRSVWQIMDKPYRLTPDELALNAWYRVDVDAAGPILKARAYPDGQAPPDWQLQVDLNSPLEIDHAGERAFLCGLIGLGTSNCRAEFADHLVVQPRLARVLLQRPQVRLAEKARRLAASLRTAEERRTLAPIRQAIDDLGREIGTYETLDEPLYRKTEVRLESLDKRLSSLRRRVFIARGGLRAACTYANFLSLPAYKANLHCHTRHSDGSAFCDDMARRYEELGFRILAMSDHDAYGDQDGGVYYPEFQKDQVVHDWDGDGVLHETREYRSGVEAYVRDYSKPGPEWVTRNWQLYRPGEFVVFNSLESSFGHPHCNCIEPPPGRIPRPREGLGFVKWCKDNGGVVFLNHPGVFAANPTTFLDGPETQTVDGLEVMNGCTARDNRKGNNPHGRLGFAEDVWDQYLNEGRQLWGFANDDAHAADPAVFCGPASAWNVVWAKELTKASVLDSLRHGAFYATCGVEVDRIEITAETLTVHSPNATHIAVIGDGGRELVRVDGQEIRYRLDGSEEWLRVKLWNDTIAHPGESAQYVQQAWLQPILVDRLLER